MTFRKLLTTPGVKVGTMITEFATPGIGYILKEASLDYAFLDMEHSGFGIDTLKSTLRFFEAADLPVIVRPPSKAQHHISRALDAGAEALLLPMVGSGAEAAELVQRIKYPPLGKRGVGLGMAHDKYSGGNPKAKLKAFNKRNVFIALIETMDGLENVDDIASTKGVDGLWIGHFDLSTSMGIAGEFTDKRFTIALKKIGRAAANNTIPVGQVVPTVTEATKRYRQGTDLICYSGDTALLQNAAREGAEQIRTKCK
jgi:2-dehydro-3-deoxyglucarate aldolase